MYYVDRYPIAVASWAYMHEYSLQVSILPYFSPLSYCGGGCWSCCCCWCPSSRVALPPSLPPCGWRWKKSERTRVSRGGHSIPVRQGDDRAAWYCWCTSAADPENIENNPCVYYICMYNTAIPAAESRDGEREHRHYVVRHTYDLCTYSTYVCIILRSMY